MKIFFKSMLAGIACIIGMAGMGQDCTTTFYPMRAGIVLTLEHFDAKSKSTGKTVQTIQSANTTAGGMQAVVDSEVLDKKDKSMGKHSYVMSCEQGTLKISMRDMVGTMLANQPQGGNIRIEVTGDNLDLPTHMKVGQSLSGGTMNMKSYMNNLKLMDWDFTIKDRKVEGVESITVPAGTFECYKVSNLMDYKVLGRSRTAKTIVWYATGAGMVRQDSYDESNKLTGSSVLISLKK